MEYFVFNTKISYANSMASYIASLMLENFDNTVMTFMRNYCLK